MPKLQTSDQQLCAEIRRLFQSTTPQHLRRTIEFLYFSHTSLPQNQQPPPENFQEISADVYQLIDFLDKISEEETKAKITIVKMLVDKIRARRGDEGKYDDGSSRSRV